MANCDSNLGAPRVYYEIRIQRHAHSQLGGTCQYRILYGFSITTPDRTLSSWKGSVFAGLWADSGEGRRRYTDLLNDLLARNNNGKYAVINLQKYRPNDVLFWTGAGISIDPPSCLPSGYRLTKDIVDAFCLETTWNTIEWYLSSAKIKDASGQIKKIPRLESILGCIVSILGYNFLARFKDLFNPAPNFFHHFFAYHIKSGGKHVTLNLDIGIENALEKDYPGTYYKILTQEEFRHSSIGEKYPYILHLHGSQRNDSRGLGLTIENISKGLLPNTKDFLINQLRSSRLLVFCGYSGSDFFDVNPFFLEMNHKGITFPSLKVVWVNHRNNFEGFLRLSKSNSNIPILRALNQAGAECYMWNGPTREFFHDFIRKWQASIPNRGNTSTLPTFDKSLPYWQRALVTAKIFVSMGLGQKAQEVLKNYSIPISKYEQYCSSDDLTDSSPRNRVIYLFNESLRELGYYKDATSFANKLSRQTKLDELLFLERRASDYWLMGRIFYARSLYFGALQYGVSHIGLSERFDNLLIECLRGYMQVCRDISYIPLIGKYVAVGYFNLAVNMLRNNNNLLVALKSSPYDMSHISRLVLWELDESIAKKINTRTILVEESYIDSVFSETDNFLGCVNVLRSKLKKELMENKVHCDDIRHLFDLSHKITSHPGVVKAAIMCANLGLFENVILKSFIHSFRSVQWTFARKIIYLILFVKASIWGALTKRCT